MSFFEQGKIAYFAGISRGSNPHAGDAREQWFQGWDAAHKSMSNL
jgi:ribosome modulation factor